LRDDDAVGALVLGRPDHLGPLRDRRLAVRADLVVPREVAGKHAAREQQQAEPDHQREHEPPRAPVHAAATARRSSNGRRNLPVYDPSTAATSSGVPTATISPPSSPPSGPRSTSQSACLMTSRLCSITSTVLPPSTSRCSTSSSFSMSAKCRPVVGSSRMYSVLPVAT